MAAKIHESTFEAPAVLQGLSCSETSTDKGVDTFMLCDM